MGGAVVDPRNEAVLVRRGAEFVDKTLEISALRPADGQVEVTYRGSRTYPYKPDNVRLLTASERFVPSVGDLLEVDGEVWANGLEASTFATAEGLVAHILYRHSGGERWTTRPVQEVRVIGSSTSDPRVGSVLAYWQGLVGRLAQDDPLRRVYQSLSFVHDESVLTRYLVAAPILTRELPVPVIYPFRSNLSQREAVEHALTSSISVIEGPPGTGKTETILNIIANIVATGAGTVGVVSFGNSAVDNVREKLDELGFGHVVARLGRKELMDTFFAEQQQRNARVADLQDRVPQPPPQDRLKDVDTRLRRLQRAERERARLRQEIDAYRLELQHFEKHVEPGDLAQLDRLPLLRRSSDRILDYLAESTVQQGRRVGLVGRVRQYLRYGSLRGLDPDDADVVLRLQRTFYERRLAELAAQLARADAELSKANFDGLVEEHRQLSVQALHAALGERYAGQRKTYEASKYRTGFEDFAADYPVVLSTCHSLRRNLPEGYLLDYLIIDEASMVDLLAAGAVLASCRNLIVVGDLNQLEPVFNERALGVAAPYPNYAYEQSILASIRKVYADVPRTLLREHYRCDPAIIGFCNKAFYDGRLVPFTRSHGERPMLVVRTAAGNHMRTLTGRGNFNQREIDVVLDQVKAGECAGLAPEQIGITSPYRLQVDKLTTQLRDPIDADTVHKYQGRQRDAMIMSTVLDETKYGHVGVKFVDGRNLVNVAVSRAVRKFVLVTNQSELPRTRNIRDLIGYIDYQALDDGVVDSEIVSVFDLLYREYSERLRPFADRLRDDLRWKSENIIWTLLHEIVAEPPYRHLTVVAQLMLSNLMSGMPRHAELTEEQASFLEHMSSVDFVVYNRISNRPELGIEVDGFKYHENNPEQLVRDGHKNAIFAAYGMPLLRLPTTGSGEAARIRAELDRLQT
ncbi:AAA domain-containing protein [Kribbella sp. GL6]|uniref:AAA domain-containing protein n=1 Tax=Kribbella sp. GL6 TaxID=3419765 RepID=UPI003CFC5694